MKTIQLRSLLFSAFLAMLAVLFSHRPARADTDLVCPANITLAPLDYTLGSNLIDKNKKCKDPIKAFEDFLKRCSEKNWKDGSCFKIDFGNGYCKGIYDNGHGVRCTVGLNGQGGCCLGVGWKW